MGTYLNPGNYGFAISLRSQVYVDKSGIIAYTNSVLNTQQRFICVSRPRRFGKTVTAEMLTAYYSCGCDSEKMFEGRAIESDPSFLKHLNKYNVICLNIQDFLSEAPNAQGLMTCMERKVLPELRKAYPDFVPSSETRLADALNLIFQGTGKTFMFIVDEWDCVFRVKKNDTEGQIAYLDFLRALWKDKPYVCLVYMTGILPIKKYGTHSALNMFEEFSMTDSKVLSEYPGFTEKEVCQLCEQYQMNYSEMQRWYDGYQMESGMHFYNPKSVVDALRWKRFGSYWTQTETYEALKIYIDMNFDGLKDSIIFMLGGGQCKVNPYGFANDMATFKTKDDVLTLLIHLGYLGYDAGRNEVFIPNEEIRGEFLNAIQISQWEEVTGAVLASEALLEAVLNGDTETVAKGLDSVHTDTTSILSYNNENALSCVISLAFYSARNYYILNREFPAGKGFADIIFRPRSICHDKPALLVELKWNKSAEGAVKQIKEKQYVKALDGYMGTVLLVGINYDKENKKHECMIETFETE